MGCIPTDSPECQVRELRERLKLFTEFALAQKDWEAKALTDGGSWCDEMLECTQEEFEKVQALRSKALGI